MAEQHRDKDQQNYLLDQARTIRDGIEVPVFGPAGHTPPCAEAWPTAKLIAELRDRVKALEAKDEDDKEAWAARLRRPGRSQGERIASLVKRIEALEATQRAINQSSTNRIHLGLGDTPQSGSIDLSHLSDAEREKILKLLANPGRFEVLEIAQPAKPNHPEIPDSSLVERVAAAIHPNVCADPNLYLHEARAAIRAVADWLLKNYGGQTATTDLLEQEAER